MKKEELKDLLLKSLSEEVSDNERAMLEKHALPDYKFSPSFSDRVMSSIASGGLVLPGGRDLFAGWSNTFLRVALTGAAAIIVLAVSLFLTQGSLSYDTLLGLDTTVDEGLVSLLIK